MPPVPKPPKGSKPKAPQPKAPQQRGGSSRNPKTLWLLLGGAALVAVVVIVVGVVVAGGGDDGSGEVQAAPVSLDGIDQSFTYLGNPDAKVTMLEFADIQCPFCKKYAEDAYPGIVEEYVRTGKIKMNFRGLKFIGADSEKALRFVLAAGLQDKAWNAADLLYANQGDENSGWVTDDLLRDIGAKIPGLDVDKAFADMQSEAVTKEIQAAAAQGEKLEVGGTPWFYLQVGDDDPYLIEPDETSLEGFKPALDDALASAEGS